MGRPFRQADIDYAMLVKVYGEGPKTEARYSPAVCVGARKDVVTGRPHKDNISTSHVERSNLSLRMHMRRYTRLTNAHSKKFENHCHMVALYTVWYNFARINSAVKMAPAMAAGVSKTLWTMDNIVALIETDAPKPGPRSPYKSGRKIQSETVPPAADLRGNLTLRSAPRSPRGKLRARPGRAE